MDSMDDMDVYKIEKPRPGEGITRSDIKDRTKLMEKVGFTREQYDALANRFETLNRREQLEARRRAWRKLARGRW